MAYNCWGRGAYLWGFLCQTDPVVATVSERTRNVVAARIIRGVPAWGVVAGAVLAGLLVAVVSPSHVVYAAIAIPVALSATLISPQSAVLVLPVWMTMLGLFRRLAAGGSSATLSGDPMLLIGPITIIALLLFGNSNRSKVAATPFSRVVLAFNIVAIVEAANPNQGGFLAGVAGLLFVCVPTLAFWVGRRFGTEEMLWRVAWTIALLSLFCAMYGLYQQFVSFPSWDLNWINSKGYTALNLGSGVVRAFSTFSSAQEYAVFLSVGVVTWAVLAVRQARWPLPLHLAALAVVATALFYESQRTSVFITALALGVILAARLRFRPVTVGVAALGAVVALVVFAGAIGGGGGGSAAFQGEQSAGAVLANHQLAGITDPTGSGSSLPGHIKATRQGVLQAFKHPLGHGSGSVNLAASHFSTKAVKGTEFDPGNMGIAFGIAGVLIYLLLLRYATSSGYRIAVRRRDPMGLFVLGVTMATLLQWTNGNLYSVCWLLWLVMGIGDGMLASGEEAIESPQVSNAAAPFQWRRPGEPRRTRALS